MYKLCAVNAPMLLKAAVNIVYNWLDEFVQQKIIICSSKSVAKNLLEFIEPESLEV
jgi:hypothetical protein